MSCVVFVWRALKPGSSVGHASLLIKGSEHTYMSWWPSGQDKKGLSSGHYTSSMSEDKEVNKRGPDWASAPINGLNEDNMIQHWNKLKSNKKRYEFLSYNCTDVVLDVMEVGGLYDVFPKVKFFRAGVGIVEPSDIKRLALKITNYKGEGSDITDFLFRDHFSTMNLL